MMKVTADETGDLLEVRVTGKVAAEDYETVLTPAVEAALEDHERIRMLVVIEEGFEGYDWGAAWADSKLGLSHWRGFERVAVVCGSGWVRGAVRAFAPLVPCPVQLFDPSEEESARRWMRESLGAVHLTDLGGPALMVQLMGRIDPDAIARAEAGLAAHIRERDGFRLLLDLRAFDGWQGLSALSSHFSLVREHAPQAERVGVIGDKAWQRAARGVAARFLNAKTAYFEADDLEGAKAWLTA